MYRDSEMVIWFASRGLASLVKPLLRFAWPVLLIVAVLGVWVWPWATSRCSRCVSNSSSAAMWTASPPESSRNPRTASGVLHRQGIRVLRICEQCLHRRQQQWQRGCDLCQERHLRVQQGVRMAVLTDGQRIETKPDGAGLRISQFQEYALRLSDGSSASAEALATKSQPTAALLASDEPKDRAELGWRLGLPLAALNFVLLALAITNANPRAAKSTSLAVALLAFVVYNLMTVGQSWVVSGRMSMLGFLLGLHGWSWGSPGHPDDSPPPLVAPQLLQRRAQMPQGASA
jgi:lipopolysaccharide export system permease protein